jgi:hypothetical protein
MNMLCPKISAETDSLNLLQELSPGHSVVLATFETSAIEFLFPFPQLRPTYTSGVDVDLLMEPTRDFPGIISPKVRPSTAFVNRRLEPGLVYFRTKNINFVIFWRTLKWKMLVYFMSIRNINVKAMWYMLWLFVIFCDHFGIFHTVLVFCTKKNLRQPWTRMFSG